MTQKELSDHLGVSASAVGMYEQERRTPDVDTLQVLCTMFNITADYLLFGKGTGTAQPISVNQFLESIQRQIEQQKGLLYEPLAGNQRRVFTSQEIDKLSDAIRIGVAMSLGITTDK